MSTEPRMSLERRSHSRHAQEKVSHNPAEWIAGSDLLSSLRQQDQDILLPFLEMTRLKAGEIVYKPGDNVGYCYFPTYGGMCSYFIDMDDGLGVETILIGREGALGGIVSRGSLPAFARAKVLHEGTFLRITMANLQEAKDQSPAIAQLFNRYADCMMAQVFQSIACNAVHTIEQRAAKWLSAAVDRIGRNEVVITQEQLASMMGIGRSYASRVLQRFKRESLLRTRRGGLEILDKSGLKERACSCNDQVHAHFEQVLKGVYPATD